MKTSLGLVKRFAFAFLLVSGGLSTATSARGYVLCPEGAYCEDCPGRENLGTCYTGDPSNCQEMGCTGPFGACRFADGPVGFALCSCPPC
jgi:hypothetical protein